MKEYEKWFKKAEGDLMKITNVISLENAPYDLCCFHAQQAAEKYLKSYLVVRNSAFPKTHDLVQLIELCLKFNTQFNDILQISYRLSEYGVTPRYPDGVDDIEVEEAKQAYQNALTIKEFVITHFFD